MENWKLRVLGASTVAARFEQDMWIKVKPLGYSRPVVRILSTLAETPDVTDRVLADSTGMTGPQLSRDVRLLIERKLVSAEVADNHKGQRQLRLTETGLAAAKAIEQIRVENFDKILSLLTPVDRSAITRMTKIELAALAEPRLVAVPAQSRDVLDILHIYTGRVTSDRLDLLLEFTGQAIKILNRWLMSNAHGFVIRGEASGIIGYALLMSGSFDSLDTEHDTYTMIGPFVLPPYRRRGIGSDLLKRCLAEAQAREIDYLSTRASTHQTELVAMLAKAKFRKSSKSESRDLWEPKKRSHIFTRVVVKD